MPFLGSTPADQYQSLAKQTITGDGSTAYTLNRSVTNAYDMEVFINNVRQEPDTSYTASGNTITFTAAVTASDSCYLIYQGQSVGSINPPAGSVGGTQIQNTSVTTAHLHTSLDLSSKTLTMPAGHIIQTVTNSSTTTVTATSTTPVNLIAVSITPKFANSVIHIESYIGALEIGIGSSNAYCSCYLNDPSGNQITRSVSGQMAFGTDTHTLFGTHSPSSTSSQTYQVTLGTASGGTGQVHTNSQRYSIRAMEIAQ